MHRQGDLLIKRINKLPKGLKPKKDKVLAEGEFTGHSHRFEGNTVVYAGEEYFKVNDSDVLIHEDHKPIKFEPGVYTVNREREYDYFDKEVQRVRD